MSGGASGRRAGVPSDRPLTLQVERGERHAIVRMSGSCTMEVSSQIRHCLVGLAQDRVPLIVVEMRDLDFIDSNGLGGMVAGHLRARHHHGTICVASPSAAVRELLELTRLSQIFPSFPDVDSALAAYARPN